MTVQYEIKEFRSQIPFKGHEVAEIAGRLSDHELFEYDVKLNEPTGIQFSTGRYTYIIRFRKKVTI